MFLIRSIIWLIRKLGPATVMALLLLGMAWGSTLRGLASVIRGFDMGWLGPLVAGGVLLGWGLGRGRWSGWRVVVASLSLGLIISFIRLGNLGGTLLALAQSLLIFAVALFSETPADPEPIFNQLTHLGMALGTLLLRLGTWLNNVLDDQPAYDPVATGFIWSLGLWEIAVWSGWWVRRHRRPVLALLPVGGSLVTILAHSRESIVPALIFLTAMLLLIALIRQQAREARWVTNHLSFSPEIRTDLLLTVVPLSLVFVLIAATVPAISIRQLSQLTRTIFGGQPVSRDDLAARALGLKVNHEPATPLDDLRQVGLPRGHLLGSGPELSEEIVMVIQTNAPPLTPEDSPPRYYWRSHTYDRYTGRGWLTSSTETIAYDAGETIDPVDMANQQLVRQTVHLTAAHSGLLYAAGELITADQPFSVAWRGREDIFGTTTTALAYQADSWLPIVSAETLRAEGSDYPAWVRRRYLSLPASIPNRVLTLARDLTATEPTPYDRAKAIESYLRAFPYSLDLPAPPTERDITDYFIFDLQRGYCDYYATAMVVLARAAGLPARLAVGYISGTYDRANRRYLVSEAEAHAWVELYFPDIGWVTFEPTGGRPAIDREVMVNPAIPPEMETSPEPTLSQRPNTKAMLWWLLPLVSLALLIGGFTTWRILDTWRLRRLTPAETVAVLQQRLVYHGRRLHLQTTTGNTPYEFVTIFVEQINSLATRKNWGGYLDQIIPDLQTLTGLYVQASYSPHRLDATDQANVVRLWQRLRWRLWLAELIK